MQPIAHVLATQFWDAKLRPRLCQSATLAPATTQPGELNDLCWYVEPGIEFSGEPEEIGGGAHDGARWW